MFAEEYCTIAKKKCTGHSLRGVTTQVWRAKPSVFLKNFVHAIYSPFFQTIQVIGGFSLRNKSGQENQRNLAMGN